MIPTQHVYKIKPDVTDPDQLRVLYTCSEEDRIQSADHTMYRFPHCPSTFWTHFRFIQKETDPKPIHIELIVITEEDTTHSILTRSISHEWYDLQWPIPSFDGTHSGIYLKVHGSEHPLLIHILGWIHLFPIAPMYLLHGDDHICQFAIFQETAEPYEKNVRSRGAIHNTLSKRIHYCRWERHVPNQPMVIIRPLSQYR